MSYNDFKPEPESEYVNLYVPVGKVRFPSDSVLDDANKLAAMSGECVTVQPAAEVKL